MTVEILATKSFGCIDRITCRSCGVSLVCDSMKAKEGMTGDGVKYIYGPCCCGMTICSACGGNISGEVNVSSIECSEHEGGNK